MVKFFSLLWTLLPANNGKGKLVKMDLSIASLIAYLVHSLHHLVFIYGTQITNLITM